MLVDRLQCRASNLPLPKFYRRDFRGSPPGPPDAVGDAGAARAATTVPPMAVRSAVLWGSDHTELGEIAVAEVPPASGLGISRGKFRKGYPYLDPNEDAVLVAADGTSWLLAVADGHGGFDAARAAIAALQTTGAEILGQTDPEVAIATAARAAHAAIVAANWDDARAGSATTLAVALVIGDQLTVGSFGDSMVAVARDQRLLPVNRPSPFLDAGTDPAEVQISQAALQRGDVVLAATDGLTDFLGSHGPRALARTLSSTEEPGVLVRLAVEQAFAGGAGDNIAVALMVAPAQPRA